jgi:antitoxin MazE
MQQVEVAPQVRGRRFCFINIPLDAAATKIHCRHMTTTVQKWGNSLALRIPSAYAAETNLAESSPVELRLKAGSIVIRPVTRKRHKLDTLLRGITPRNRHTATQTGPAVGQEVW